MAWFRGLTWTITLISVLLNLYIYTYPSFIPERCSWNHSYENGNDLLGERVKNIPYFGDLYKTLFIKESSEKLPEPRDIRMMAFGDPQINGNWPSTPYIKRLDNFGNDYYLGHIYRVMKSRLHPTHVVGLGDLFSSQWIADSEFYNRTRRYMTRLFPRPEEQTFAELDFIAEHKDVDWVSHLEWFQKSLEDGLFLKPEFYHYENVYDWSSANLTHEPLFINVSGNHDIGYGDTTYQHMTRWRRLFGKDNYWIEFDNDTDHPWRIVVLNSLALDGPLLQPEFKDYTWQFVETLKQRNYSGSSILLTHIPMYKPEGLCVDGPLVEYFNENNCHPGGEYRIGLLKSENHLQYDTSQAVMNAVFKGNYSGIIVTGHDHEGCENFYNYNFTSGEWQASKSINSPKYIKEVTVRSMMGDFDGNTGLITGHFNQETKTWEFNYKLCPFVVQHVWWAAQIGIVLSILFHSINFLL
ncbi:hypothetical protein KL905_004038 [Ogataea polymorpha]|nr:uncharacterized protein OGAPODRAFT_23975 [Ogataea polymorpha]KAG7878620.1 hypothetical protein KL937_003862 [Ogataea polymorpha]KAG7887434.1 hypothetical protein KL936_004131 [Ogataea polymorpha]KAG7890564.1 hypothetical protein KL908_004401 [Ogataea polymorpha]KAG7898869.1 hypothetical protein KL935_003877 [Ogataea polymorpha]KAG7903824.1 hypothetical protein KL907_003851 [Ogataea polymorpha]